MFVTIAAACFVSAIAIDLLTPPGLTLSGGLQLLDENTVATLQRLMLRLGAAPAWATMIVPLLHRPAWMLPIMLGLVTAGLAVTIGRHSSSDTRRGR